MSNNTSRNTSANVTPMGSRSPSPGPSRQREAVSSLLRHLEVFPFACLVCKPSSMKHSLGASFVWQSSSASRHQSDAYASKAGSLHLVLPARSSPLAPEHTSARACARSQVCLLLHLFGTPHSQDFADAPGTPGSSVPRSVRLTHAAPDPKYRKD